jgi:hypothetical protein
MGRSGRHSCVQVNEDLAGAAAAQSCVSLGRDASKWQMERGQKNSVSTSLSGVHCFAASVLCRLISVEYCHHFLQSLKLPDKKIIFTLASNAGKKM